MNIIPTIFNEKQIDRTVLGGSKITDSAKMPVSVILLNSGGNVLRLQNLENLQNCGFEQIISMETNLQNYNFEDFIKKFPNVKFIVPQEENLTDGDLINIAMQEIESEYVLILRDTIQITNFILYPNAAQKLIEKNCYCYVPRMFIEKTQGMPAVFSPTVCHGVLDVEISSNVLDMCPTLYPFDFIGLYNRKKFIQLGGYDYTITNPYWQNLDLSMRAWLWGESINVTTSFQLSYIDKTPINDKVSDINQFRFFLKNLLPVFVLDHGEVLKSSLFRTFFRSPCGIIETFNQFNSAKRWIKKNQYRFKRDAVDLVRNWGIIK